LSVIPCVTLLFVAAAYWTTPPAPPENSRPERPRFSRSKSRV